MNRDSPINIIHVNNGWIIMPGPEPNTITANKEICVFNVFEDMCDWMAFHFIRDKEESEKCPDLSEG